MLTQQELKPQNPPSSSPRAPEPRVEEDLDELYEDEPRRRSWGAIASVVLALGLVFVGYQWNQAVGRERLLASQVSALRADADSLRLRAEEAQRGADLLQKRMAAVAADKDTLAERLATLERTAQARARDAGRERAAAAREPVRAKATPVSAKASPTPKKVR